MRVGIFIPCFIDQLFPDTAVNMVRLLRSLDCEVLYNTKQTCCGQPAYNAGFVDQARDISKKWLKDMQWEEVDAIVCPSASCVGYLKNHLDRILNDDNAYKLLGKTYELCDFLIKKTKFRKIRSYLPQKATYHDSCAALRECNIKEAPRKLLARVKGLELIENPKSDVCCGFGGTFAVKFEPISVSMAEQKINHILALGVNTVISSDWSCLMHLKGYAEQKGIHLNFMHIADVLVAQGSLAVVE